MRPHERLEELENLIDELILENSETPVIVEGRKDERTLRRLGLEGPILRLNKGVSVFSTCEEVSKKHNKVILLTDWDRRGGHLAKLLREGLEANGVKYDDDIRAALGRDPGITVNDLYESFAIEDIRAAADILRPVYDGSDGADGFVSLEVSPLLASNTDATVAEARRRVDEQIGQFSTFDGHQDDAVEHRLRRVDAAFARSHTDRVGRTNRLADAAPQAQIRVAHGVASLGFAVVCLHAEGVHGTNVDALAAAPALVRVDLGDPVRGNDRPADVERANRADKSATAFATRAYSFNFSGSIQMNMKDFMNQTYIFSLNQYTLSFFLCDCLSKFMINTILSTFI